MAASCKTSLEEVKSGGSLQIVDVGVGVGVDVGVGIGDGDDSKVEVVAELEVDNNRMCSLVVWHP